MKKRYIDRRDWLKQTGIITFGIALSSKLNACKLKKNSTILLVSGWQDVNIGDITHTPGLLHVLETFLPEAKLTLWKKSGYNEKVSKFNSNNVGWSDKRIREVEGLNERCKEWDHAKMREAMIAWVRETGNKVLVCPEMTYQVDIMDELLIKPLPDDVKPFVIKRGYWLPDEAASVYSKAYTVLSFECHSPIIAAANGTPFFYLRQPEDSIKGQMYYDLNFDEWIFEIEETEGKQITDRLREIWTKYQDAEAKLKRNMDQISQIYSDRVDWMKPVIDKI